VEREVVKASDGGEAFEDREAARVAQEHLDRMFADIAVAAENLHSIVGHTQR